MEQDMVVLDCKAKTWRDGMTVRDTVVFVRLGDARVDELGLLALLPGDCDRARMTAECIVSERVGLPVSRRSPNAAVVAMSWS